MPILFDYAARAKKGSFKRVYLEDEKVILGKNELPALLGDCSDKLVERFSRQHVEGWHFQQSGFALAKRRMNLMAFKDIVSPEAAISWGNTLRNMHGWLSDNIQSPWLMLDSVHERFDTPKFITEKGKGGMRHRFMNNGVSCKRGYCNVHIERIDEQKKFTAQYPILSEVKTDWIASLETVKPRNKEQEIEELAIVKGVVAPFSKDEDYDVWLAFYRKGYTTGYQTIEGVQYHFVHPECDEAEKILTRNLVESGPYTLNESGLYLCPSETYEENSESILWPKSALAFGDYKDEKAETHFIGFKSSQMEDIFINKWGNIPPFSFDEPNKRYSCPVKDLPKRPKRHIPEEFIAYLHGKGPDPSLKMN